MRSLIILVILSIVVTHTTSLSVKVTHSQNLEPTGLSDINLYAVGSSVISLGDYYPLTILKRDANGVQSTHVFDNYGMTYSWPLGFAVGDSFYV